MKKEANPESLSQKNINKILSAKSFAVIGASRNENKVGHIIFKNLLEAKKEVYAINPNADRILGQKVLKDLNEIPTKVDCAIIAIKSQLVYETLQEIAKKSIPSAIILSAGFSETGSKQNIQAEIEIKKLADTKNITLLGPNSFGIINTNEKINTTFFQKSKFKKGTIAFISQSGAIGSAILDKNKKLSHFISIGNAAQTDFTEFIEYLSKDKNTKSICLYIESIKENKGIKFVEACQKCEKPIFAFKAGKSKAGQKAAKTHTAALATDEKIYEGIFKQAGVIECDSIEQMFDAAEILETWTGKNGRVQKEIANHHGKFKARKGRSRDTLSTKESSIISDQKSLIITNAGGLGVLATDYLEKNKVRLAEIPEKTKEKLKQILPNTIKINNPLDILGDANAKRYQQIIETLDKEDFFNNLIILLTPQHQAQPLQTAKEISKIKHPVLACFYGGEKIQQATKLLKENNIKNFKNPKSLAKALGKVVS